MLIKLESTGLLEAKADLLDTREAPDLSEEAAQGQAAQMAVAPASERIRERIFYAREEISILLQLMERLMNSEPQEGIPNDEPSGQILASEPPVRLPFSKQQLDQQLTYIHHVKESVNIRFTKDVTNYVNYIRQAIKRLTLLIEREQSFFGGVALEILRNNWVLKARQVPGMLYIDYGYQSTGSLFSEVGEADVVRKQNSIELLPRHSELFSIQIYQDTSLPERDVYDPQFIGISFFIPDNSGIIQSLAMARIAIFEAELFELVHLN